MSDAFESDLLFCGMDAILESDQAKREEMFELDD